MKNQKNKQEIIIFELKNPKKSVFIKKNKNFRFFRLDMCREVIRDKTLHKTLKEYQRAMTDGVRTHFDNGFHAERDANKFFS